MDPLELATRRILIVGGRPYAVTTLRTVLGLIGITKVGAFSQSEHAIKYLCETGADAVFCDEAATPVGMLPFPLAARRSERILNPMVPIFLMCGSPLRRHVERARDDGVTDVLALPLSASTVARKLRGAFGAPRPFILAGDFFGPDRRGSGRAPFDGPERRKRLPRKLAVAPQDTGAYLRPSAEDGALAAD